MDKFKKEDLASSLKELERGLVVSKAEKLSAFDLIKKRKREREAKINVEESVADIDDFFSKYDKSIYTPKLTTISIPYIDDNELRMLREIQIDVVIGKGNKVKTMEQLRNFSKWLADYMKSCEWSLSESLAGIMFSMKCDYNVAKSLGVGYPLTYNKYLDEYSQIISSVTPENFTDLVTNLNKEIVIECRNYRNQYCGTGTFEDWESDRYDIFTSMILSLI